MSASGLSAARLRRLDGVLSRHVEAGAVPGLVAVVARRGEVHTTVLGTSGAGGTGDTLRRDTVFRLASLTKMIAAAAAMVLTEECLLRLDDPVDALLPELAASRVLTQVDAPLSYTGPAVRPITVRDLLTFTFGLGLGETAIFDEPNGQWSSPPAFPSGAGGLVATIDDYAAFAGMLRGQGGYDGARILSRPAVSLMTADQLTPAQKAVSGLLPGDFDDTSWGFGVSVVTRRTGLAKSVGSYGWDGGLGTSWFNDPAEDLTAILMTQRMWTSPRPGAIFADFWTSAYQAIDD